MQSPAEFIPRISQLDALLLDNEFYKFVRNQLVKILDKFQVSHYCQIYEAEFDLVLKSLLWKLTVLSSGRTIGQRLLGLKYEDCGKKYRWYFLVQLLVPYFHSRISAYVAHQDDLNIFRWLRKLTSICRMAEILNFCIFLMKNKYPTLGHRLSRLRMEPAVQRGPHAPGDSYQVRELLWHQFSDFLLIAVPFMNLYIVRNYWNFIKQYFRPKHTSNADSPRIIRENVEEHRNTVSKCCHCSQDATIPHKMGKCSFCYYCLKANGYDRKSRFQCSLDDHIETSR